jgi:hypothetical protein
MVAQAHEEEAGTAKKVDFSQLQMFAHDQGEDR